MSDGFPEPGFPPLESESPPFRRRSFAWLAWLFIIGLCAFMVLARRAADEEREPRKGDQADITMKMQSRYLVGADNIFHQKAFYEQSLKTLRHGGVDQRLRFIVLANELAGPGEALKQLNLLDKDMAQTKVQPTPDQARLRNILGRLYRDYRNGSLTAPSLTPADRVFLRQHLDWFGELALAPPGIPGDNIAPAAGGAAAALIQAQNTARQAALAPAKRTFFTLVGMFILGLLVGLGGLAGLIVFIVFVLIGKVKGMQTGAGNGGIYAETFAVWLILFLCLALALSRLLPELSPLLHSGFLLLSLFALGWPVLRGIPWSQVREDLGLNFGRKPLLEPIIGLGCYAMALPLVGLGLVVTLILLQIQRAASTGESNPFAPTDLPSHPIVETVAHGGWPQLLGVIFLASVAAPLIEETMFRGVLYRHLREASSRFGAILSFFVSAILVSFLFAVIHPQGIFAVPVLMALAFGFTMAREWRGSLVPAMVGHAFNNGIVVLVLAFALGD
jgi:membrane protease YdiL (CAAX protease family)